MINGISLLTLAILTLSHPELITNECKGTVLVVLIKKKLMCSNCVWMPQDAVELLWKDLSSLGVNVCCDVFQ